MEGSEDPLYQAAAVCGERAKRVHAVRVDHAGECHEASPKPEPEPSLPLTLWPDQRVRGAGLSVRRGRENMEALVWQPAVQRR